MDIDEFHAKQPDKGNSVENIRDKEVETLKYELKRSRMVCKAIWAWRGYVDEIKGYIEREEITGASELWEELDFDVQKLLNTAPTKGGPFTTEERAIVRGFWKISTDDIEGKNA